MHQPLYARINHLNLDILWKPSDERTCIFVQTAIKMSVKLTDWLNQWDRGYITLTGLHKLSRMMEDLTLTTVQAIITLFNNKLNSILWKINIFLPLLFIRSQPISTGTFHPPSLPLIHPFLICSRLLHKLHACKHHHQCVK